MQSIPGLKKCFNLVASLSKKIFNNVLNSGNAPSAQNTDQKSTQNQQQSKKSEPNPKEFQTNQQQNAPGQKVQPPKIICFETYLQNRSNPLKVQTFGLISGPTSNFQKTKTQADDAKAKNQQSKGASNIHKNYPYTKIENRYTNSVKFTHESPTQKPYLTNRNTYPPIKRDDRDSDHSADDQLQAHGPRGIGKKQQKNIKKQQKHISVAESLDINTDDMIFTYDDGDDISSIAAKSETTDEIQPELLSFINKKGLINYVAKFQEQKHNNFPSANMKKKLGHYQGETIPRKAPNIISPKQDKKVEQEPISRQKTKKRAFQLYPGETFQQFKKRIFIQNNSSSSDNSDDEDRFPGKLIKKEEYEKILSQLNSSMSKMDEEKNKQASILVVQKMVDESENQESEECFKRQQPILDNIENYKIWDNAGDNSSFRLYYRDS